MKVVKKGTKHEKEVETTCRECDSVLREKESKLKWEDDRDGRLARETCPVCGHEIFFY